jgi:hypothetical protein
MKIKNVNLEWYAFRYDINSQKLIFTNVLACMEEEIAKKVRKGKKDNWNPVYNYNTFKEWIKDELMYRYWCKSEHECLIGDYCSEPTKTLEKHDIWWQLEPNLDRICEYIIKEMKIEFKK